MINKTDKKTVNKYKLKFPQFVVAFIFFVTLAGVGLFAQSDRPTVAENPMPPASDLVAVTDLAPTPAAIKVSASEALAKPNPLGEIVLGDPSALVTVVEYASLTCGHCGAFHNQVLPEIKRDYVDKGLVKFYFRPFPFDGGPGVRRVC